MLRFEDRVVQFPNRVVLVPTGKQNEYDVTRAEGNIIEDGTPLNAETLNNPSFESATFGTERKIKIGTFDSYEGKTLDIRQGDVTHLRFFPTETYIYQTGLIHLSKAGLNITRNDYSSLLWLDDNGAVFSIGKGVVLNSAGIFEFGNRVYSPNNKPSKSDVGLGNVANERQYSSTYPQVIGKVTSEFQIRGLSNPLLVCCKNNITVNAYFGSDRAPVTAIAFGVIQCTSYVFTSSPIPGNPYLYSFTATFRCIGFKQNGEWVNEEVSVSAGDSWGSGQPEPYAKLKLSGGGVVTDTTGTFR